MVEHNVILSRDSYWDQPAEMLTSGTESQRLLPLPAVSLGLVQQHVSEAQSATHMVPDGLFFLGCACEAFKSASATSHT